MAINSEVRHNGMNDNDEPMGRIVIDLSGSLGLQLYTEGVMNDPAFLEMANGYLRQYIDRCWQKVWEKQKEQNR